MCGLVGYYGKGSVISERVFRDLLLVDQIRGPHSTGVLFVREEKEKCRVVKDTELPIDLMNTKEFIDGMTPFNKVLMGHNRWATKGAILKKNAHPFVCGNIVGAHNGTLHTTYDIDGLKYDTDSEAIFNYIHNHGIEATWKKLDGAAAITYWDRRKSTMNLARNPERPLFFSYAGDGDGIFWASEGWMLVGCAERNNVKLEQIFGVPANTVISFQLEGGKVGHSSIKLETKPPFIAARSSGGTARDTVMSARQFKRQLSLVHNANKVVDTDEELSCIFCYDEIKDVKKATQIDHDCYVCESCANFDRKAGGPLLGH